MGDLLQGCNSSRDAIPVITKYMQRLFPDLSGGIYLSSVRDTLEVMGVWGEFPPEEQRFDPDDCWALRRGRQYLVEDTDASLPCPHLPKKLPAGYQCWPLAAQGKTLGVLHLRQSRLPSNPNPISEQQKETNRQLISSVVDQFTMTLVNLKLRETSQAKGILNSDRAVRRFFMKPGAKVLVGFCLAGLVLQPMPGPAQKTPEELHKETLAACAASAKTRPSFEMIKEKVDKACDLLTKEGKAAFPKFKGKNSDFIFCGTYIWVHDLKGVMRMDPAIPQMEGMKLIDVKDGHDKRPFFEMNKVAKEKGAGWVDYWWPKPGAPTPSRKISYIKLCQVDGEDMVVGAGVYDLPDNQIDKLLLAQKTSMELAKETEAAVVKTDDNQSHQRHGHRKGQHRLRSAGKRREGCFPEV